jgi:motility quorum-sensing regulator/GCU-specific mRNA interferase toxin
LQTHDGSQCVEKKKPTYDLEAFKASCAKHLNMTTTTRNDAVALGFTDADVIATIQTMERSQFYKSMNTLRDHKVWQDVYHIPSEAGMLYVKFMTDAESEFLLIGFKEK